MESFRLETGVIKPNLELRVENDHLTAENDGLTIENWYQNGQKHNKKNSYFETEKFRNMDACCIFAAKIRNAVTYFRNGWHV